MFYLSGNFIHLSLILITIFSFVEFEECKRSLNECRSQKENSKIYRGRDE